MTFLLPDDLSRDVEQKRWTNATGTLRTWIKGQKVKDGRGPECGLSHHLTRKAKGFFPIVFGKSAGKDRTANAMVTQECMTLDVESGDFYLDAVDRAAKLGIACIAYTSFNDQTKKSHVERDKVLAWMDKAGREGDPTDEDVREWMAASGKYRPEHVASARIAAPYVHTPKGVMIEIAHDPLDKFRMVFPLDKPVEIGRIARKVRDGRELYKRKLLGLAAKLGLVIDESCIDVSRAFYMPSHPPGAEARDRAAQSYLALDRAADAYHASSGRAQATTMNLMYNFQDLGVMLAAGQSPLLLAAQQGTQIGAALEASGAKGKQVLGLLKEAALSVVSPVNLITIGAIAAGAALFYAFQKAIPPTKSLAEALKDLDAAMSTAKSTAGEAADLDALTQKYAGAAAEVQALANAKRDLARLEAETAYKGAKSSFYSDVGFNRWWDSLRGFAGTEEGRVRKLAQDFDLTTEAATRLNEQLLKAQSSTNAEMAASHYAQMRQTIVDAAGGMEKLTTAQKEVVGKINEMEGKAREFARLDMARPVTDAKTATDGLATSMSGVAAQALRVLNTLQALAGIKVNISAPVVSTPTLPKAKPISAPAPKASGDIFDRITNVTDVSYQPIKATSTPAATKPAAAMTSRELQAVITASVTRTGALQAEKSAAEQLTDSLKDRLTSLQAETLTLQTVAAGTYQTEEAARLYAEAATTAGGAIDDQTAAMIRQIDAARKLNEVLQRLASDPVRDWLDSVPTWVEAGRQIEEQALDSLSSALSDFATTGKFDINALGDAIAGTAARVESDMAVKELVGMLGGNVTGTGTAGFGLGDIFGAMFGTVGAFSEGGYSTSPVGFARLTPANFRHAPHYAEGTANTSGIPAILHDNEAVIPLSRGRKVGVELNGGTSTGGTVINAPQTITINTPDADSFRRSKKQVAADLAVAGVRAARQNR